MKALGNKLLALATVILLLPAGTPRAQQDSSSGLFPPTSQDFQALWQELRERSEEDDWKSVLEKLETWIGLLDNPGINLVISNDAGVSLGVRRALGRFVQLLQKQEHQNLQRGNHLAQLELPP